MVGSKEVMDAPSVSQQRVTDLLVQWSQGDDRALAELTPLVYDEFRRVAHHYLSGQRPNHTLQTTALVNEAYLRLAGQTNPRWQNRAHFFAVAARAMRQILVSYARTQQAQKRGGCAFKVDLDEAAFVSPEESKEIVELHEALEQLSALDSRKAQIVELKYFGGLNYDEIAEVLKISRITVRRDCEFAKVGCTRNCGRPRITRINANKHDRNHSQERELRDHWRLLPGVQRHDLRVSGTGLSRMPGYRI
jgi:RNA polymerase sigma-70 factor (ECF subfamily)